MTGPLEESAEELTAAVQALNESIRRASDVRDQLDVLVKRSKSNRRMIRVVAASVALDVILTVGMAVVGAKAVDNANRIKEIVKVQHDSALCPLYKIFIDSDTPANRDRAASQGQDMAERERNFAIIRKSYAALNCENK